MILTYLSKMVKIGLSVQSLEYCFEIIDHLEIRFTS